MLPIKLAYPVNTLDGKELLPAGVELTDQVMAEVIGTNGTGSYATYSLLSHDSVKQDFLDFLNNPPYDVIFDEDGRVAETLAAMGSVRLIEPIIDTLDYFKAYDFHTYRHMLMIFALTTLVAKDLESDQDKRFQEVTAGPTHDFGKICVPISILTKPEPFTRSERRLMSHHAVAGYVLLSYYFKDSDSFAARVARDHHERRDCSGYPRGLALEDKMVEIVAACDVYDALISPRPYRPVSFENRTALEIITEMAENGEVGWEVVQSLVSHNRKEKPNHRRFKVSLEKRGRQPVGNAYGVTADEEKPVAT